MPRAMIRQSKINSSSALRLHHDAKRLSIPVDCYGFRRSRSELCLLNRLNESILRAGADPQRTLSVVRVCCQEKYRIQSFAAGVAVIRYLLRSKFSHFSNYPLVEAVARRVS